MDMGKLFIIMVVFLSVYVFFNRKLVKKALQVASKKYRDLREDELRIVTEYINGIKTIRIYSCDNLWRKQFYEVCQKEIPLTTKVQLSKRREKRSKEAVACQNKAAPADEVSSNQSIVHEDVGASMLRTCQLTKHPYREHAGL